MNYSPQRHRHENQSIDYLIFKIPTVPVYCAYHSIRIAKKILLLFMFMIFALPLVKKQNNQTLDSKRIALLQLIGLAGGLAILIKILLFLFKIT